MSLTFEIREGSRWFHRGTPAEVRALEGVDWSLESGGFGLVTGPSGSGKTTLLALLGSLERPTSGTVSVGGEDLSGLGERGCARLRRRLGLAFAAAPLLPRLQVWENVTYGLVPLGAGVAERRSVAERWLDRLGLAERAGAAADELSSGERQRAVLARALAGDPDALLVDEPLANLDEASVQRVVGILDEFNEAGGTVIVATHLEDVFGRVTGRLRLEHGRSVSGE